MSVVYFLSLFIIQLVYLLFFKFLKMYILSVKHLSIDSKIKPSFKSLNNCFDLTFLKKVGTRPKYGESRLTTQMTHAWLDYMPISPTLKMVSNIIGMENAI